MLPPIILSPNKEIEFDNKYGHIKLILHELNVFDIDINSCCVKVKDKKLSFSTASTIDNKSILYINGSPGKIDYVDLDVSEKVKILLEVSINNDSDLIKAHFRLLCSAQSNIGSQMTED
jgi:hypothetical protein